MKQNSFEKQNVKKKSEKCTNVSSRRLQSDDISDEAILLGEGRPGMREQGRLSLVSMLLSTM